LATVVLLVLVGLFSKEHAVVAIAVLALDHFLTDRARFRSTAGLYPAVAAATLAWLYLFRGVAGQFVEGSRAAVLRGLSDAQRVATMLPVQLDVIRLLTWPFDLVSDYNPQTIAQRTSLDWVGVLGGVVAAATVALAVALFRRAPVITFGVFAGIMTYAPTSNILFASGVALAERNLYLAVLAPAAALGWVVATSDRLRIGRWVLVGVGAVAVAFAAGTLERVRAWEDTRSIVIEDIVQHPENYRTRLRLASYFITTDNTAAALAEGMVAAALFPNDAFISTRTVPWALQLGYHDLALEEARRAHRQLPDHSVLARLVIESHLALGRGGRSRHLDSAVATARDAIIRAPGSEIPIQAYDEVLVTISAAEWKHAVNQAKMHYVYGRFGRATAALERAIRSYEVATYRGIADCWDLGRAFTMAQALEPALARDLVGVEPPACPALQF
jgi:tetratricopeptide (TPR) repeat protein